MWQLCAAMMCWVRRWVELMFTNRFRATRYMKVKRMGITESLRRIWLFSANKIKSYKSGSKQPFQLIVEVNSSLGHIIVIKHLSLLIWYKKNSYRNASSWKQECSDRNYFTTYLLCPTFHQSYNLFREEVQKVFLVRNTASYALWSLDCKLISIDYGIQLSILDY